MTLQERFAKRSDAEFRRGMINYAAQHLPNLEVERRTRLACGWDPPMGAAQRNGDRKPRGRREPGPWTSASRNSGPAVTSRPFRNPAG